MTRPGGRYGPWPVRGWLPDGTAVTVWFRLTRDENGDPVPALRIDGDQEREVTLHAADSAQLITNLRLAWGAAGEIKLAREDQQRQSQQPRGRGPRR